MKRTNNTQDTPSGLAAIRPLPELGNAHCSYLTTLVIQEHIAACFCLHTSCEDLYKALVQAVARAEQAWAVLWTPYEIHRGKAFTVQVLGLHGMIQYAREEQARVERSAPALVAQKRAKRPSLP